MSTGGMRGIMDAARLIAPTQVIIVHARQIVMDERIGMHRLNGRRRPERLRLFYAVQARGFQHQKSPLAAFSSVLAPEIVNCADLAASDPGFRQQIRKGVSGMMCKNVLDYRA